jgi:2-keto-4-pentenoate hydratase
MIAATEAAVAGAVERLERADRTGTPCRPVRDLIGVEDLTAAYAVQRRLAGRRAAAGARVPGCPTPIGLTCRPSSKCSG